MFPQKAHIEIGSGIRVYTANEALRAELRTVTTHANPAYAYAEKFSPYGYTTVDPNISLSEETDEYIKLPRGFDYGLVKPKFREILTRARVKDMRHFAPTSFPKSLLQPNTEQQALLGAINGYDVRKQRPHGNYLMVASTSTGKTIAQALAAKHFGQRTLVLCKTNMIRKAWQADLHKLFGLDKKEIGIIQQSKYTIGKQFTLSSLATLHRRQHLWDEIFANFGCVILDECHLLPAQQIYTFVSNCPCAYVIGATATERRSDGKQFMMYAVFGKPVKRITAVKTETESSMPITNVKEVPTEFRYPYAQQDLNYQDLLEHLVGDDARNELVVSKVLEDWKLGKSVLVTSCRVAHCQMLAAMLIEAGVRDASLLTGAENQRQRESAVLVELINKKEIRCVVATDATISTGANLPPLERLHMATPIVDKLKLNQLLGRLRRKYPGKKSARVRYYKDTYVPYLMGVYKRSAVPVFRQLEIEPYTNLFMS